MKLSPIPHGAGAIQTLLLFLAHATIILALAFIPKGALHTYRRATYYLPPSPLPSTNGIYCYPYSHILTYVKKHDPSIQPLLRKPSYTTEPTTCAEMVEHPAIMAFTGGAGDTNFLLAFEGVVDFQRWNGHIECTKMLPVGGMKVCFGSRELRNDREVLK